jgi:hypothetical protein
MISRGTRSARRVKRQVLSILDQWVFALESRQYSGGQDPIAQHMKNAVQGVRDQIREIKVR